MRNAFEITGFKPSISILEGLKDTYIWFKENEKEHLKRKNYFTDRD